MNKYEVLGVVGEGRHAAASVQPLMSICSRCIQCGIEMSKQGTPAAVSDPIVLELSCVQETQEVVAIKKFKETEGIGCQLH